MQIVVMAWSRNCHRFREDVADQKKAEKFEAAAFNSISFNQRADNMSAKAASRGASLHLKTANSESTTAI